MAAPALRKAIAATYEGLEPEDILCFAGAEEGLYCAMLAALGPGDHAIVHRAQLPVDGNASGHARRVGERRCTPSRNKWQIDIADVRAACSRTRS